MWLTFHNLKSVLRHVAPTARRIAGLPAAPVRRLFATIAFFSPELRKPLRLMRTVDSTTFRICLCAAMATAPPLFFPPVAAAAGLSGQSGVFKVVKPPPKGARKRITIHNGTGSATPPGAARTQRYAWFWDVASPSIDAADPARLPTLAARAGQRLSTSGKADRLRSIAGSYVEEIGAAARIAGVSPRLMLSVIAAESGGNPKAVSHAGAQGLAQLMPATAQRFGVSDPFDPAQNLAGSAAYLSVLHKLFKGDTLLALAGYNAGENAVIRHKGVPPFAETRDYVPIVLSYYHAAGDLCASTPRLPVGCAPD